MYGREEGDPRGRRHGVRAGGAPPTPALPPGQAQLSSPNAYTPAHGPPAAGRARTLARPPDAPRRRTRERYDQAPLTSSVTGRRRRRGTRVRGTDTPTCRAAGAVQPPTLRVEGGGAVSPAVDMPAGVVRRAGCGGAPASFYEDPSEGRRFGECRAIPAPRARREDWRDARTRYTACAGNGARCRGRGTARDAPTQRGGADERRGHAERSCALPCCGRFLPSDPAAPNASRPAPWVTVRKYVLCTNDHRLPSRAIFPHPQVGLECVSYEPLHSALWQRWRSTCKESFRVVMCVCSLIGGWAWKKRRRILWFVLVASIPLRDLSRHIPSGSSRPGARRL